MADKGQTKAAPSGGRLLVGHSVAVNERIAESLHKSVVDELVSGWTRSPYSEILVANYTKKVLDHLVLLEEEVQDLHRRNHQLSRRLRALQNKIDVGRRAK